MEKLNSKLPHVYITAAREACTMPIKQNHTEIRLHILNRLYWSGYVCRKDLVKSLKIGTDLASRSIGSIRQEIPLLVRGQSYVLDPEFDDQKLINMGVNPDQFLNDHLMASLGRIKTAENRAFVSSWVLENFRKQAKPEILQAVVRALSQDKGLEISYVGMNLNDNAKLRHIEPIALVHANGRWHLDAYCYRAKNRRDFVLSRILAVGNLFEATLGFSKKYKSQAIKPNLEKATFAPHPLLTADQVMAVSVEFGLDEHNCLNLECSTEQLFYFRKEFVAAEGEKPPVKLLIEIKDL